MQISLEIGKEEIEVLARARRADRREAEDRWNPLISYLVKTLDRVTADFLPKPKPDLTVAGGDK